MFVLGLGAALPQLPGILGTEVASCITQLGVAPGITVMKRSPALKPSRLEPSTMLSVTVLPGWSAVTPDTNESALAVATGVVSVFKPPPRMPGGLISHRRLRIATPGPAELL